MKLQAPLQSIQTRPETVEIKLSNGGTTVVDQSDFEAYELGLYHWYRLDSTTNSYAIATKDRGKHYLHRLLLGLAAGDKRQGDHRNLDSLDNRRCNLRVATASENQHNKKLYKNNKCGFKGVHCHSDTLWVANVVFERRQCRLGSFGSPAEAAFAYDCASKIMHGEFACCNGIILSPERSLEVSAQVDRRLEARFGIAVI